ncbi:MAG: Hpt domain-containing protein, partial [Pseudobdellovibrionaceae bacterium]|nr:Hpt domain-containing protein [Pseudobdellovibrionaceae bacterium]
MLHRWALIFIAMSCIFGSGHADSSSVNPAFAGPWYLTEHEDASWASDPSLVHPETLVGWHSYSESTVPMGLNKTVWLRNELPWIPDGRYILYFASGLEDLSVYIDGQLVYSFGQFTKQTIGVSRQRWHMITLGPQHSHKPLMIRTHYAIGYMLRTLYPTIRDQTEVMAEHARSFVPIILAAGAFGALGLVALVIALMRRQADIFFYFGLMSTATCSWLMFNQDSLIKPYVGLSEKSWEYFDLFGIYIIIASFFSFLADAVQSRSPWVRSVIWLNWGLLTIVALAAGMGLVHAWYFIPVLHIILLFGLAVMIPLIIRSAIQKHADARLLMAGSLTLSLTVFHDLAHYSPSFQSPIPTMAPIGGFVVISLMVMILARRYQAEREEAFATQTQLLDNIKALNTELQNQLERVEALVEEKTRAIRSIMGHIQQGIFLLTGSDFSIHEEYSKFLEVLLDAKDLAHKSFARCFLDKCRMDEDQRSRFLSTLVASMGEAVECFDMNVSNLPTEVYIAHGENEKIVELSWAPMVNEHGVVDKILVAARDITSWRQLQLLAQKSQEEMELLQVILQAKPERFSRFLDSCHQLLGEVRRALEAPHHNEMHGLQEVFRALHTLKGNARSFNLGEIASLVHVAENVVQLLQ